MRLLVEKKPCFLERYFLILHEVSYFFHGPNNGYNWFINGMVFLGIIHTPIHVVSTKPKLMKLERCTQELKPETKISYQLQWSWKLSLECKNVSWCFAMLNIVCATLVDNVLCTIIHLHMALLGPQHTHMKELRVDINQS